MPTPDWSTLNHRRGLVVEGNTDKQVIEAFLSVARPDWRSRVEVKAAGGFKEVLASITHSGDYDIWVLIDHDWRTESELQQLRDQHSKLLILPRIMIENYCVDPSELRQLLPSGKPIPDLSGRVESQTALWVQNGALWQTLSERDAFHFCRGHESGYPMALLHTPGIDTQTVIKWFDQWRDHLRPDIVLERYSEILTSFEADREAHYTRHIHGKQFFRQVIIPLLNSAFPSESADAEKWFSRLFGDIESKQVTCPQDIQPLFDNLFETQ